MSKYIIRSRQRTVQYAITLVYKTYDPTFVDALTNRLYELYPLSQINQPSPCHISHVRLVAPVTPPIHTWRYH